MNRDEAELSLNSTTLAVMGVPPSSAEATHLSAMTLVEVAMAESSMGAEGGKSGVSVALLCAMPTMLDATHVYVPALAPVTMAMLYVGCRAPGMTTLLKSQVRLAGGTLSVMQVKEVGEPTGVLTFRGD